MRPFGAGNPIPVFLSRKVFIKGIRFLGKEENHVRFQVVQGRYSQEAIGFNLGDIFRNSTVEGQLVDLVYKIQINVWGGREKMQLNLLDVRSAEIDC